MAMKWFGLRVSRNGWAMPSLVMVNGVSRSKAVELLSDAGYLVLPDRLEVATLMDSDSTTMVVLGAPANPPLVGTYGVNNVTKGNSKAVSRKAVKGQRAGFKVPAEVASKFRCACGRQKTVQDVMAERQCSVCRSGDA